MDADALTRAMQSTHLDDKPATDEPGHLLFNPSKNSKLPTGALDNIPRYLFRVVSPLSDGHTDSTWVRSKAACQNLRYSQEDIFDNLDSQKRHAVAHALNLHLRWWSEDGVVDNFVSWTSSLLFALQYIYYRHHHKRDGSSLEDIKLYVVDTTSFPRGTFLRDLDLMQAFFDPSDRSREGLNSFRKLREGSYYFGEYLTQGSLRITDKHQVVSASSLFRGDLLQRLQPVLLDIWDSPDEEPRLANAVRDLRGLIWPVGTFDPPSATEMRRRLLAVEEITNLFDEGWRFPLAVYFAALIGPEGEGWSAGYIVSNTLQSVYSDAIGKLERSDFRIIAPETMPELGRVQELISDIYMDFLARRSTEILANAKMLVLHLSPRNVSTLEDAFPATQGATMYTRLVWTQLAQFANLRAACEQIVTVLED
ncbi:hypothetical protein BJX68DRAFT_270404 [Aspergillus pseudodeflectus]|uniref:DUF7587 domain-containing protein n=1 Tax=Aspergillus pseudodeflectus TaxID=176178 RepID=A0ABR4JSR9_9EURO